MRKLEKGFFLVVMAALMVPATLLAQAGDTMASSQVSAWSAVIKLFPEVFKALKTDDALPILVVLCNLLVALLKTEWFQKLLARVSRRESHTELTDAGKTFLALFVGMLITWFFSPAATEVRTLGKGLMLGFAAIGMYHTWKHTLKRILIKNVDPETGETVPPKGPEEPEESQPA